MSVLVLHGVAAWWLSSLRPHPAAEEGTLAPITVDLIAPMQAPPTPAAPAPEPPRVVEPPKPKPPAPRVVTSRSPAPTTFEAEPEPVKPVVSETPPSPLPPVAPPAPAVVAPAASAVAAPPPAEPQPPKQLAITSVSYLVPPQQVYPEASRRLGESGVVYLKVLVDERGRAEEVQVAKSSGYSRLDRAAESALRAARFRPYMEGGTARRFWVTAPFTYDLSD